MSCTLFMFKLCNILIFVKLDDYFTNIDSHLIFRIKNFKITNKFNYYFILCEEDNIKKKKTNTLFLFYFKYIYGPEPLLLNYNRA